MLTLNATRSCHFPLFIEIKSTTNVNKNCKLTLLMSWQRSGQNASHHNTFHFLASTTAGRSKRQCATQDNTVVHGKIIMDHKLHCHCFTIFYNLHASCVMLSARWHCPPLMVTPPLAMFLLLVTLVPGVWCSHSESPQWLDTAGWAGPGLILITAASSELQLAEAARASELSLLALGAQPPAPPSPVLLSLGLWSLWSLVIITHHWSLVTSLMMLTSLMPHWQLWWPQHWPELCPRPDAHL